MIDGGAGRGDATVVLFTLSYPYGIGESFLEEEVDALARGVGRVIVVPVGAVGGVPRSVPAGVVVLDPAEYFDVWMAIRQLLRRPGRALTALIAAARARASLRGRLAELRFRLATDAAVKAVVAHVSVAIDVRTPIVFYAYWLDLPVSVAIDVRRAMGLSEVPIIARAHGFDVYSERHRSNYLPRRREIFQEVARVYSVSRAGAEYLQRRWPVFAGKVSVAHLGTRPALNPGNAEQKCATVVSCSYIRTVKRLELLIEVVAELRSRGRHVTWSHIGPVDDRYAVEVQRRAQERLDPGAFTFIGGLDRTGIRDWYATNPASVFVNLSSSEGVPVAVMEALAQGLPVVLTDVGGNGETVDLSLGMYDGLVDADPSPQQVADRIEALLEADPAAYDGYAKGSYAHWKDAWSSETNYDAFTAELVRVARKPGEPFSRGE